MKAAAQIPGTAPEEGVFTTSQLARIGFLGMRGQKERHKEARTALPEPAFPRPVMGRDRASVPATHLGQRVLQGCIWVGGRSVGVSQTAPGLPVPRWKVFWQG